MNSKVTQKNKQYSKEKKNTKAVRQRKKKSIFCTLETKEKSSGFNTMIQLLSFIVWLRQAL